MNETALAILQQSREKWAKIQEEKRKPKLAKLEEKVAKPLEPERAQEVFASTQAQFHAEERRQLEPAWRRNRRLYGSTRPPSEEEIQLLRRQTRLDQAIEAARERKRAEAEHIRALDEFRLGLWD
jgi:hypothetical protein